MPRGYGGVGILWKKDIDHLVTVIPDGGVRIQCLELKAENPVLIISVYLPCRGSNDSYSDFADCIDQLNEVLVKYKSTHDILLGGDFNEIHERVSSSSRRSKYFQDFLSEHELVTQITDKTFVHSNGTDSSTIDFIFYHESLSHRVSKIELLRELLENNSDHYPLKCHFSVDISRSTIGNKSCQKTQKVKWDKADKDLYVASVSQGLQNLNINTLSLGTLDNTVTKFNEVLEKSACLAVPAKTQRQRQPKLQVWTPEITSALAEKKKAFHQWKINGHSQICSDPLVIAKVESAKRFRKACRIEVAKQRFETRQEILNARSDNMILFHKLVNKQRGKMTNFIEELHVSSEVYKTEMGVLTGWYEYFRQLVSAKDATIQSQNYHTLVQQEFPEIEDICKWDGQFINPITKEELLKAISKLNHGKAADINGVTAEHFMYSDNVCTDVLLIILNDILKKGSITDSMKVGLLTPVFKKKGSKLEAKNYRGITVIPVLTKILELVLRERIKPTILEYQNKLQRGFTEHASPLNAALILEEYIRDRKDSRTPVYIAFLDAKSAFDVVSHDTLMRKLFHIGIEGSTWSVINSLHRDAQSAVKWQGQVSEKFQVQQGVRQGGILSADLYKVYNNRLLDRLTHTGIGARIGNICCVAPACADDVPVLSDDKTVLQSLVDIAVDYSQMELFLLQPVKSVVLEILNGSRVKNQSDSTNLVMNGEIMPTVDKTSHVGIHRSNDSDETTVIENVKKARRTLYSLMPAGLHGENGLDPETSLHLYQIYVIPILLYGLEVVLPRPKIVDIADKFNKKYLKCLLSVPVTTADAAVYVLSGTIPIQGMIDQRVLCFYGSICRLHSSSIEKQIALRQLTIKSMDSNSWFIAVKKLLIKYGLPEGIELLDNPPAKGTLTKRVSEAINKYWTSVIQSQAILYSSLCRLNASCFSPGTRHPLLYLSGDLREVPRLAVKLKLATGTYILQTTRAAFNQNPVKSTCMICNMQDETLQHFMLDCSPLDAVREPILNQIRLLCRSNNIDSSSLDFLQLLVDCSACEVIHKNLYCDIERLSRKLSYALHVERYKRLSLAPKRTRKKKH